jgi:exonuclease VII large subunit
MAETKVPTFGEINTIRDILMGEQMVAYDTQFKQLNQSLDALEQRLGKRIDDWIARQESAQVALEQRMNERLQALEKQLSQQSAELGNKIETVSSSDRARLGNMLSELGQQISQLSEEA